MSPVVYVSVYFVSAPIYPLQSARFAAGRFRARIARQRGPIARATAHAVACREAGTETSSKQVLASAVEISCLLVELVLSRASCSVRSAEFQGPRIVCVYGTKQSQMADDNHHAFTVFAACCLVSDAVVTPEPYKTNMCALDVLFVALAPGPVAQERSPVAGSRRGSAYAYHE